MNAPTAAGRAMIERLIAFDTTSRNSNLDLIDWVRGYLAEHGVTSQLVPDETGKKANLYATIGPEGCGGIMLSGHTDVVPIDGQDWDSDPWTVVERDDRLYGRGTCDMKSFVALVLAQVPDLVRRKLHTPVHLAFSYDEEVGCLGAKRLVETLRHMPVKPRACIVGEPTEMRIIAQHKGKRSWRGHVCGLECHSSIAHTGVNAVEYAAEMVTFLRALAREKKTKGPFDKAFDPPYSTIHTGTIQGGTALNIVPKDCSFDFEIRYLPDDSPDAFIARVEAHAQTLLAEMRAVFPDASIRIEPRSEFPGLATPEDADVIVLAKGISGHNASEKVSFGTEAGLFSEIGIPTIVCGPGSIEQAHKPNEFIALEQIAKCEEFLGKLADRLTV
jgi:acetylornithine deacetylase